mmetsp:Transcript_16535/g.19118  ORF Transcript_16535/g.19118 Transcript_16535/m.19118 type:complete len:138 (+) Transcript_16535:513-926(+)
MIADVNKCALSYISVNFGELYISQVEGFIHSSFVDLEFCSKEDESPNDRSVSPFKARTYSRFAQVKTNTQSKRARSPIGIKHCLFGDPKNPFEINFERRYTKESLEKLFQMIVTPFMRTHKRLKLADSKIATALRKD